MFGNRLHLFIIISFVNLFFYARSEVPQVVFCADPECSVPISKGRMMVTLPGMVKGSIGFKKGDFATIFGKTKEKEGYWGAKINEKIGFVPSNYVQEQTVWKSLDMLKYEVQSDYFLGIKSSNDDKSDTDTKPNSASIDPSQTVQSPLANILHKDNPDLSGIVNLQKGEEKHDNVQYSTVIPDPMPVETVDGTQIPILYNVDFENDTNDLLKEKTQVKELNVGDGDEEDEENAEDDDDVEDGDDDEDEEIEEINVTDNPTTPSMAVTSQNSNDNLKTSPEMMDVGGKQMDNTINTEKGNDNSVLNELVNDTQINDVNNNILNESEIAQMGEAATIVPVERKDETQEEKLKYPDSGTVQTDNSVKPENENVNESNVSSSSSFSSSDGSASSSDLNAKSEENVVHQSVPMDQNAASGKIDAAGEGSVKHPAIQSEQVQNVEINKIDVGAPQAGVNNGWYLYSTSNPGANIVQDIPKQDIPVDKLPDSGIPNSVPYLSQLNVPTTEVPPVVSQIPEQNSATTNVPLTKMETTTESSQSNFYYTPSHEHPQPDYVTSKYGSYMNENNYQVPNKNPSDIQETTGLPPHGSKFAEAAQPSQQPEYAFHFTESPKQPDHTVQYTPQPPQQPDLVSQTTDSFSRPQSTPQPEPTPYVTEAPQLQPEQTPNVAEVPSPTPQPFEYQSTTEHPSKDETTPEISASVEPIVDASTEAPLDPPKNDGGGFFSTILSWVGLSSTHVEEPQTAQNDVPDDALQTDTVLPDVKPEVALDGSCKSSDGLDTSCSEAVNSEDSGSFWSFYTDNKATNFTSSYNTFIYLVVTAVTVLLFTLGYYFIEKFRDDGPLIAKVNKLEQELLVSSKECVILKDELANTKEKLNLFETSSNDKIITALQLELEEAKKIKSELEGNIEVLQQELDSATEAGLDLNRMLSEVLTQKGGSETLMESVEHLQSQLNSQQKIIDEMTTKLITKSKENEELQEELAAANEKNESLESEVEDLRGNLNVHLKDNEDLIQNLTENNKELQLKINQMNDGKEKEMKKLKKMINDLETKLKTASSALQIKEEECGNLKDAMKKIKMKDNKTVDWLFEASRMKAELEQSSNENKSLKERLKAEEEKCKTVGDKCKNMEEEVADLKKNIAEAEREKAEAQTRLEVLSNYFKEKETQLQKELGLKEAMWVQKQGDDSTIYERMKSLEEEIENYKSQNETLKKEILDQERGLKSQITTLEKKAHENWIAARQAERKSEEYKQESAQLRNKLTLMEKNISNDLESNQHARVGEEINGGDTLSPLIHDTSSPILFPPPLALDPNNTSFPPGFIPPPMFMPPPPGGFMPPPPFLPGDHRPPPLGRMSSPPLNNRFSPPPPDYSYDRMSTPPLSPSSRNYRSPNESERERERFRHRTPTSPSFRSRNWEEGSSGGMSGFRPITSDRNSRRDDKGGSNLSSGHSSDSLDKSGRHSGRV